jgi:hypothetical protein
LVRDFQRRRQVMRADFFTQIREPIIRLLRTGRHGKQQNDSRKERSGTRPSRESALKGQ